MKNDLGKSKLTTKEKQELFYTNIGIVASFFGKIFLEASGHIVHLNINGEDMFDIENLHYLDLSERIKLAVKEERYDDAHKLKKLLDSKTKSNDKG